MAMRCRMAGGIPCSSYRNGGRLIMNIWDFIVGAVLIAAVVTAIYLSLRRKKNGGGCCGDCSRCSNCTMKKDGDGQRKNGQ